MKRWLGIFCVTVFGLWASSASAATLKPLASSGDWASEPIFATAPPNDGRVFVVERGNAASHQASIRIVEDGVIQTEPFLTVPNVDLTGERGLLSMAFAPDYATSGLFYVFWVAREDDSLDSSTSAGDIRIVEFRRSESNPDLADPSSARLVFKTPHSATNHNGGWMAFGPDGNLYFTIGDNAAGSNAQDLTKIFGKVLRIDPAGAGPLDYSIPSDNPYAESPGGALPEVFTSGLRNPFRASFAPDGDLVIGDVGQNTTEEIDVGDLAGKNMGWPTCEGFCDTPDPLLTDPFFEYAQQDPPDSLCAVLGGYVVRDPDLTGLTGRYLYGDLCNAGLRTLNLAVAGGDPVDPGITLSDGAYSLRSFGEDSRGCTYVVTSQNVYRVAAGASSPVACPHSVPPPDPPVPPVDTTSPSVALSGQARFLRRTIALYVKCSEDCTINARGSLNTRKRQGRKNYRFGYAKTGVPATSNTWTKVELTLAASALKNARRTFRSGRSLYALIDITASDPSGNSRRVKTRINIRRAKPPGG